MTDLSRYEWIDDSMLADAACITAVPGASVEQVLARLGTDTNRVVDADDAADGACVAVIAVAGGVVAVEPNGFQGALPRVLTRVAGDGSAASMFWNVNALNAFTWVRDGEVVAAVDVLHAEADDDTESITALGLPAGLHELWRSSADDETDPWSAGLAMVEAVTGVPLPDAIGSATFYALDVDTSPEEREHDQPAPDDYPERTDGLVAMRSFLRRVDELRARGAQLTGGATIELSVDAAGTPAAVFKKAVWAHGWPTSNGALGAWTLEVGNEVLHDATRPDSREDRPEQGGIFTRVSAVERPRSIAWAWNWAVPDPDGYTRWESPRLLEVDSLATLTLTSTSARGEDARTRVDLRHSGVPADWEGDLRRLWTWHLQQVLTDRSYW